jgi:hypothetical protein
MYEAGAWEIHYYAKLVFLRERTRCFSLMAYFARNRYRLKIHFAESILSKVFKARAHWVFLDIFKDQSEDLTESALGEDDTSITVISERLDSTSPVELSTRRFHAVVQVAINLEKSMRYAYFRKLRMTFDMIHYTALKNKEYACYLEETETKTKQEFSTPLINKYSSTQDDDYGDFHVGEFLGGAKPSIGQQKGANRTPGRAGRKSVSRTPVGIPQKNVNRGAAKGKNGDRASGQDLANKIFGNEVLRDISSHNQPSPSRDIKRKNRGDGVYIAVVPTNAGKSVNRKALGNNNNVSSGQQSNVKDFGQKTTVARGKPRTGSNNNSAMLPIKYNEREPRQSRDVSRMSDKTSITTKTATALNSHLNSQPKTPIRNSIGARDRFQNLKKEASPITIRQKRDTTSIRYKKDSAVDSQNITTNVETSYNIQDSISRTDLSLKKDNH